MFDDFFGLPAHPLIVHAGVIFGPLLVAAVAAYALVPMLRSRLAWIVIALAVVAPASLWAARWSGEALERRQIANGAQGELLKQFNEHQNLGDWAAWSATILGVLSILLVMVCTAAGKKPATTSSRVLMYGLIIVCLVAAAATLTYVIKTGHSGATMVWT